MQRPQHSVRVQQFQKFRHPDSLIGVKYPFLKGSLRDLYQLLFCSSFELTTQGMGFEPAKSTFENVVIDE